LAIYQTDLVGSASIGIYSLTTDKMVIIPKWVLLRIAKKIEKWLKVKLVHTTIGGSVLNGVLACANSYGILLPYFIRDEEIEAVRSVFEGNITIMETKKTAYGNMVLANDYGAIVDPRLKTSEITNISKTLGVETMRGKIAGLPYVGSLAVATNKGVLAHPMLRDSEREIIKDTLSVPVDVGTINRGIPYVGTGLIGNRYATVVGPLTTGPEMFIIGHALDVMKENE
jgi:translation initiation factor 6